MTPRERNLAKRKSNAVEAFRNASETIGTIEHGMHLFAVTRGQWSMIDAILACLDQTGPAKLSIWTWCIAEYEVQCVDRLRNDGRVTDGLLVIDAGARNKNAETIAQWQQTHGPRSVRYTVNHAKIATIESADFRLLLRGSMNLNNNPRFEQFDMDEGGPGFDLVRGIETELPLVPDTAPYLQIRAGAKIDDAWSHPDLLPFNAPKVWSK